MGVRVMANMCGNGFRLLLLPVMMILAVALAACGGGAPDLTPQTNDVAISKTSATTNLGGGKPASASQGGTRLKVVRELPPPPRTQGGTLQPIAPNDLLEITFFGVDKLNRVVRVSSTGHISMPLVGSVKAAGKSVRQLERDLERLYGKSYLQSPQITINVKESFGQRITVNGQVRRPGIYPIAANATLLQAIAQAQGFTPIGDPTKVFVFRNIDGTRYVAQYNVEAISGGKRADPRVYGGDIIVVFASSSKVALENLKAVLGVASQAGRLAVMPLP